MGIPMQQCKRRLATLWFICAGGLFLIVLFQTFFGHYGKSVNDAWGWLLPTVLPTLSLIVGVLVSDALGKGIRVETVDKFLFKLTFGLSATYLFAVFLTIAIQPVARTSPPELMKQSNLWLGPFQGLVSASLGAFFVRKGKESG
jgi:hypothetical protein